MNKQYLVSVTFKDGTTINDVASSWDHLIQIIRSLEPQKNAIAYMLITTTRRTPSSDIRLPDNLARP